MSLRYVLTALVIAFWLYPFAAFSELENRSGETALAGTTLELYAVPTVTLFTPDTTYEDSTVVITGTGFSTATIVEIDGVGASFTINSSTQITAIVPNGASTGQISVTNFDGVGTSDSNLVILSNAPTVTSFTPASGVAGDTVTITGTKFNTAHHVDFDGIPAVFAATNQFQIRAVVPSSAETGLITVENPDGSGTSVDTFTVLPEPPIISGFTPTSGSVGSTVAIMGSNFTTVTDVEFNGTEADFGINTDNLIYATVPVGATDGPIIVTNPDGVDTSATNFTLVPIIRQFLPTYGYPGLTVTITGTEFDSVAYVQFNGVMADFEVSSDTEIEATVPSGATTGPITVLTGLGLAASVTNFKVAPVVSSFTPESGAPGDTITITGIGFSDATAVKFNQTSASFTITSATEIAAIVPAGAATGVLRVTNSGGTGISAENFTLPAAITSFSPLSGGERVLVTIRGRGLTGVTDVSFNGISASFKVYSSSSLGAYVPVGATTGLITVTNAAGTATSSTSFTVPRPAVTGFTPVFGKPGTKVTITGAFFSNTRSVKINGVSASFRINSATSVVATVPASATTGLITVTSSYGTGTSVDTFTVLPTIPVIASFVPASGSAGSSVTIKGNNFTGASSVKFNGVAATFRTLRDTQITATLPAAATTGAISITTSKGTGTSGTSFTVVAGVPSITSFTPTSGAAGVSVTISGTNFGGATSVTFNGTSASYTVTSATRITAIVPVGVTSGKLNITTPGGTAISSSSFTVSTLGVPTIASFTPTSGPVGTSVTITGTNFTGMTAVRFNGVNAGFSVTSPTTLRATVPAKATSGVITIVNPRGTVMSAGTFGVTGRIAAFTPIRVAVGKTVTISGTGLAGATAVEVNGVAAASLTVLSANQVRFVVPAGATTGKVRVTTEAGVLTSASNLTIINPTISGLAPTSGRIGTKVSINGTNLNGAYKVQLNGASVPFGVNTSARITATIPTTASSGYFTVSTQYGMATSPVAFTVIVGGSAPAAERLDGPAFAELQGELNILTVEDAEGNVGSVFFGSLPAKRALEIDAVMDEIPAPEGFDVRFATRRNTEVLPEGSSRILPLVFSSALFPVTLSGDIQQRGVAASLRIGERAVPIIRGNTIEILETDGAVSLDVVTSEMAPLSYKLEQNHPNPFNPSTVIRYELPEASTVSLKVYNLLGREIATLAEGVETAGFKSLTWNSTNASGNTLPSGVYFYRLMAVSVERPDRVYSKTSKMLLLK